MTDQVGDSSEDDPGPGEEDGLVEELAYEEHEAYMTYQNAKSKYRTGDHVHRPIQGRDTRSGFSRISTRVSKSSPHGFQQTLPKQEGVRQLPHGGGARRRRSQG